jgi:signal transduction histidine kinase
LNSESSRFAALFAAVFLALACALCVAVLWIVRDTQISALLGANEADIETVRTGFREEGAPEAAEVVKQLLGPQTASRGGARRVHIVLEDATRRPLAGNMPTLEPRLGTFVLDEGRIMGRGVSIAPGIYLFVGRDTTDIALTRIRVLKAFVWILAASIVLAAVGGVFLRVKLMRRVDDIARTCEGIIAGRFDERVPVQQRGDELERLSIAINEMLNRIAALLENLRQVSSDVAHDLRTPLTRLRHRLEDARRGAATCDEYAAAMARAVEDVDLVLAMFAALLRISQIESGTRVSAFAPLSLTDLLQNIVEMYQPVAEDNQQILVPRIQPAVQIRGDAELLMQMFSNLVENAIRHTPGSTRIEIDLHASPRSGIVASVSDNGPGIPAAERDKVLRRFYRLAGSRSSAGHGLGLALVAAIANLHHATLSLSDANPGLCVSARFQ